MYKEVDYYVDFNYLGAIHKKLRYVKGGFLVVTTEPTINKKIIKVHFYYNSVKVRTMRFNKDRFNKFTLEDAITSIYMEKITKVLDA